MAERPSPDRLTAAATGAPPAAGTRRKLEASTVAGSISSEKLATTLLPCSALVAPAAGARSTSDGGVVSSPWSARGLAGGPVPAGGEFAAVVRCSRSMWKPSSRIQTCTVCSPALGTVTAAGPGPFRLAANQTQEPKTLVEMASEVACMAPSRPRLTELLEPSGA